MDKLSVDDILQTGWNLQYEKAIYLDLWVVLDFKST